MNHKPTVIYTPTQGANAFTPGSIVYLLRPHVGTCEVRMGTDSEGRVTEIRAYCPVGYHNYEQEEA